MQRFESQLHLSKYAVLFYFLALLGSLAIIFYLPWGWEIQVLVASMVVIYGLWIRRYHLQWRLIGCDQTGFWIGRGNQKIPIEISGDSTVTSWVTVLRFTPSLQKKKQSCVIFKDTLKGDAYRQLTVHLRR